MAFGEVLFEEHAVSPKMPYLFNGKELDQDTGLYYYGARYYDPKVSLWLNVDPLVEKTLTPYAYVNNNPINFIDPTGMESEGWGLKEGKWQWQEDLTENNYKERGFVDYRDDGSILRNVNIVGKESQNTGYTYLGENGKVEYINYGSITNADKVGVSIGIDATAFFGLGISLDFDWLLTGPEASFFPYFGVSTGVNLADGFNGSIDIGVNYAWFTGPSNQIKSSDLPGSSFLGSIGGKFIVGGDIGYSYSKSSRGNYGWHQLDASIGVGLEFSPIKGVNSKVSVNQQWFNVHTKTGKVNK